MSVELRPGELYELPCPGAPASHLKVGDKVPSGQNAVAVVTKLSEGKIEVGFLKAGAFDLEYPCASGMEKLAFKIELPKESNKLKKFEPLAPFGMEYPAWIVWLILGFIALCGSAAVYVFWSKRRKEQKLVVKKRELTLEEKLLVRTNPKAREALLAESQAAKVRFIYEETTTLFRAYLEERLKLQTEYFTSKELMSYIRTAGGVRELDAQKMAQLEGLFVRAEQVRFAGYQPSREERERFLTDITELFQLFEKRRMNEVQPS
jgi:hypothetical protein